MWWIIVVLATTTAFKLDRIGRSLRLTLDMDAASVLEHRHAAPILFLRSFQDEGSRSYKFERLLQRVLSPVAPVITIGKPGERFQPDGVHRQYVHDAGWQEVVLGRMREAALVIVQIGRTEGLAWELETLVEDIPPKKVLLAVRLREAKYEGKVLWTRKRVAKEYRRFREFAANSLPKPLPLALPRNWRIRPLQPSADYAWYIGFGSDWTPSLLPTGKIGYLDAHRVRHGPKASELMLRAAAGPILEENGFGLPPLRPSVPEILTVVVGGVLRLALWVVLTLVLLMVMAALITGLVN